jgi:hypothetical protein
MRKGEPGAKGTRLDRVLELEASPLLVILHYLLKNNTQFIGGNGAGRITSRGTGEAFRWNKLRSPCVSPREVGG